MAIRKASLQGIWSVILSDGTEYEMRVPGTFDDSNIGYADTAEMADDVDGKDTLSAILTDDDGNLLRPSEAFDAETFDIAEETEKPRILSRYTRRHRYEGSAKIVKTFTFEERPGRRLFLDIERGRQLRLFIDSEEVGHYMMPSLVTPHIFEVTGRLNGTHTLTFLTDNTFDGLPAEQILASSMASDDTQTNWNGLLGYVRLREEEAVFISRMTVLPEDNEVSVFLEISSSADGEGTVHFSSPALTRDYDQKISVRQGSTAFMIRGLKLREDAARWDEFEGNLHELTVTFMGSEKTVLFGIRELASNKSGRFTLNGRVIFLRGETNRAVFPETGYAPTDAGAWEKIFKNYMAYGVNFVRFASWCPPEAAFDAADRLGLMLMPELSLRGGRLSAGDETKNYYRTELTQLLRCYGSHPSFLFLAMGTEAKADDSGRIFLEELLKTAKRLDPTKAYTALTNPGTLKYALDSENDFYAAGSYADSPLCGTMHAETEEDGLRGHINTEYPGTDTEYDEAFARIRTKYKKPVIALDAGQYAAYPDFRELDIFSGHLIPDNISALQASAEKKGLLPEWPRMLAASGELKLQCCREEVEAALRTKGLSGIVFAGLQDHPGEGTAFIGMMDSHYIVKPYDFADPKRFSLFFRPTLPIVRLSRHTYTYGETLEAQVSFVNYGKTEVRTGLTSVLTSDHVVFEHRSKEKAVQPGGTAVFPQLKIRLTGDRFDTDRPLKYTLTVTACGISNSYPIWIFPDVAPVCPASVYETEVLDRKAEEILDRGGTVFFTPPSTAEVLPLSVRSEYSTDYFNASKYPAQSGTMGQLIDADHPLFRNFPTKEYTEALWWVMTTGRAMILPKPMKAIVSKLDGADRLRPLAELFECRVGRGNVLFSSMGLKEKTRYPEVRALLDSIYRYLDSYEFSPAEDLRFSDLQAMLPES